MKRFILLLLILEVGIAIGRWSVTITPSATAQDKSTEATTPPMALGESAQAVYFGLDGDRMLVDSQTGRVWHFVRPDPKKPEVLQELRALDLDQEASSHVK